MGGVNSLLPKFAVPKVCVLAFFSFALSSLSSVSLYAQVGDTPDKKPGFFIAPRADFSWYGRNEPTIGGGLCFGYDGSKIAAFGMNAVYIIPIGSEDDPKTNAIEITLFAREYIRRWSSGNPLMATGPFFQFNAGVILWGLENEMFKTFDYISGCFGLSFGWRIPFGIRFYAEPAFRIGFPYGSAAELAIGVRF